MRPFVTRVPYRAVLWYTVAGLQRYYLLGGVEVATVCPRPERVTSAQLAPLRLWRLGHPHEWENELEAYIMHMLIDMSI